MDFCLRHKLRWRHKAGMINGTYMEPDGGIGFATIYHKLVFNCFPL